jgi:hypothetical protein
MNVVNSITQFFLAGLMKLETARAGAGKSTLYEIANKASEAVGGFGGEEAKLASVGFAVSSAVASVIEAAMGAIHDAGIALVEVAENSESSKEQKAAAKNAAIGLANTVPLLKQVMSFAVEECDIEHIVTTVVETAKERQKSATPTATPISGTATPLSSKWHPSVN